MPGKARQKKGKYSTQNKKKGRPSRSATVVQPPVVAQTREPVSVSGVTAPSSSVPTPVVKPAAVLYPYISTELRTIGILAGVMLFVLVVLALILS